MHLCVLIDEKAASLVAPQRASIGEGRKGGVQPASTQAGSSSGAPGLDSGLREQRLRRDMLVLEKILQQEADKCARLAPQLRGWIGKTATSDSLRPSSLLAALRDPGDASHATAMAAAMTAAIRRATARDSNRHVLATAQGGYCSAATGGADQDCVLCDRGARASTTTRG